MNRNDSLATLYTVEPDSCTALDVEYSAGIDQHKDNFRIHIRDKSGEALYRKTVSKHKRGRLLEILEPYKGNIVVGLESSYNWYWLYDTLMMNGYPCILGHAYYLSKQKMDKHKDDDRDAANMSDLLRVGRFPAAYACDYDRRSVRGLMRLRVELTRAHTSYLLRNQCIGDQYLMEEASLAQAGYPPETINDIDLALTINAEMQAELAQRVERLDRYILKRALIQDRELYELLAAVPGIGPVTALTILYETGDCKRFKNQQTYSSYCRLVRPKWQSSGKEVGRGNARSGNPYLSWIYNSLAVQSIRNIPMIATWYGWLKKKRGARTARRVLAHRWAIAVFFMLKRREPFNLEKFLGTALYAKLKAATDANTLRSRP
jgi:transposase